MRIRGFREVREVRNPVLTGKCSENRRFTNTIFKPPPLCVLRSSPLPSPIVFLRLFPSLPLSTTEPCTAPFSGEHHDLQLDAMYDLQLDARLLITDVNLETDESVM